MRRGSAHVCGSRGIFCDARADSWRASERHTDAVAPTVPAIPDFTFRASASGERITMMHRLWIPGSSYDPRAICDDGDRNCGFFGRDSDGSRGSLLAVWCPTVGAGWRMGVIDGVTRPPERQIELCGQERRRRRRLANLEATRENLVHHKAPSLSTTARAFPAHSFSPLPGTGRGRRRRRRRRGVPPLALPRSAARGGRRDLRPLLLSVAAAPAASGPSHQLLLLLLRRTPRELHLPRQRRAQAVLRDGQAGDHPLLRLRGVSHGASRFAGSHAGTEMKRGHETPKIAPDWQAPPTFRAQNSKSPTPNSLGETHCVSSTPVLKKITPTPRPRASSARSCPKKTQLSTSPDTSTPGSSCGTRHCVRPRWKYGLSCGVAIISGFWAPCKAAFCVDSHPRPALAARSGEYAPKRARRPLGGVPPS